MKRTLTIQVLTILMLCVTGTASGQTVVRPGFNVFSVEQDVEIGKQSAVQTEKQLPMLSDAAASRYVDKLGARLAAHAPGAKFTYRFKIANLSDVNAFALPGGFIYLQRGLLEKARTEGELAAVMATRSPTSRCGTRPTGLQGVLANAVWESSVDSLAEIRRVRRVRSSVPSAASV